MRIPLKSERMMAEMKREEQAVFDFSQEQRQPVEVPKVVLLPDNLKGSIPSFMLPSLLVWIDVEKDGNCGFRASLAAQGLNECHWIGVVRRALLAIFEQKEEYYLKTVFVNSPEEMNDFREAFVWFKKGCSIEKYMVMPHAGYLIADHYRTCVHFYPEFMKMTFLPSNNPEAGKSISIVHAPYQYQDQFGKQVHSGHYSTLMMKDDSPRNVLGERFKLWKKKDKVSQGPSAKVPSKHKNTRITVESSDDEQDYDNVGIISDFEDKDTGNAAKDESVIADEEKTILPLKRKSTRIKQIQPKSSLKADQLTKMQEMLKKLDRDPAVITDKTLEKAVQTEAAVCKHVCEPVSSLNRRRAPVNDESGVVGADVSLMHVKGLLCQFYDDKTIGFRSEEQAKAIALIMDRREDVLAIIPRLQGNEDDILFTERFLGV